jgi:formyltetrahydrofolate deformylase
VTLVCSDKPGIVHAVSGAVVEASGNIIESQQFSSDDTGRFFMRLQVETQVTQEQFEATLAPVVARYDMEHSITEWGRPLRTLVLVSTAGHCLSDLLARQRDGHLNIDVPLVMGNHPRPCKDSGLLRR